MWLLLCAGGEDRMLCGTKVLYSLLTTSSRRSAPLFIRRSLLSSLRTSEPRSDSPGRTGVASKSVLASPR